MQPLLTINDLKKSFAGPVLKGIHLTISKGEIHSIIGENGAGKSTLMNIITGQLAADEGVLCFNGEIYNPKSPNDAYHLGISSAAQELSIIDTLTVAENIMLRNLPRKRGFIDWKKLKKTARHYLDMVGLNHIDEMSKADKLSVGECQLLELAKALAIETFSAFKLLILDEPTAALSGLQADKLHSIIHDLSRNKGISVIYISHRLEDVRQISDSISVMRDGLIVATEKASDLTVERMIHLMSGKALKERYIQREDKPASPKPALQIQNVKTKNFKLPLNITFQVGEVVGIAGLAGSGRTELLETLFGLRSRLGGDVLLINENGQIYIQTPHQAVLGGIGYLSKDRKKTGIFSGLSLLSNITLPGINSLAYKFGLIDRKQERIIGQNYIKNLAIKCSNENQTIETLSGGNQQKALFARWLHGGSQILLLDEPTRGVDIGAKHMIYDLIKNLRNQGKTIIAASSEIEELMRISDRILVLSNYKIVKEFLPDQWSENDILAAAFSEYKTAKSSEPDTHKMTARGVE
ncbi:MAG: sugar ABC transporter ATP-binding protein [Emcibacteraceae bacterium]